MHQDSQVSVASSDATVNIGEGTQAVRPGEELQIAQLERYLKSHLPNLSGTLSVEQFPGGASNLTYLIRIGAHEMVLRRPPFGNQVKSAHDMGREFRVLSKLHQVYAPAPKPLVYCEDESVLGAPFYAMERRRGIVLRNSPDNPPFAQGTIKKLCGALIENLAKLHAVDYQAAGLSDLGKPDGYTLRQVEGWTKRYINAQTDEYPEMKAVINWLQDNMPTDSGASVVHNDYKYDNVMFDPNALTRIVAVLDWEMCTIGDPLMDLGTTLGYWIQNNEVELEGFVSNSPTALPGSFTRKEIAERYGEITGRDISNMLFYYNFGLFKIAVIIQQIYARYVKGFTRDQRFADFNKRVALLAQASTRSIAAEKY